MGYVLLFVFVGFLLIASFTDLFCGLVIPDWINVGGTLAAVVAAVTVPESLYVPIMAAGGPFVPFRGLAGGIESNALMLIGIAAAGWCVRSRFAFAHPTCSGCSV